MPNVGPSGSSILASSTWFITLAYLPNPYSLRGDASNISIPVATMAAPAFISFASFAWLKSIARVGQISSHFLHSGGQSSLSTTYPLGIA